VTATVCPGAPASGETDDTTGAPALVPEAPPEAPPPAVAAAGVVVAGVVVAGVVVAGVVVAGVVVVGVVVVAEDDEVGEEEPDVGDVATGVVTDVDLPAPGGLVRGWVPVRPFAVETPACLEW